jgi:hypothetical protein
MPIINSHVFKRNHNIPIDQSLTLQEISKLSGMSIKALQEVYNRGIGAYKTNPESVRPMVQSKEQWAMARVYSFVLKRSTTFGKADKDIAKRYNL